MRPFLYFLLGFTLAISAGVSFAASPGDVVYGVDTNAFFRRDGLNTSAKVRPTEFTFGSLGYMSHYNTGYATDTKSITYDWYMPTIQVYVCSYNSYNHLYSWEGRGWTGMYVWEEMKDSILNATTIPITSHPTTEGMICSEEIECPDSDSDGTCDACDVDPENSECGGDEYLKGYYQYNGQIVATISSCSASDDSYDIFRMNPGYSGNKTEIPGYSVGLGMPSTILADDFIAGGGTFTGLIEPEKTTTSNCGSVSNVNECPGSCQVEVANDDANEKVPEDSEPEPASTEDKQDKAPYLNPDQPCDNHRARCANGCGSTAGVANFACSESTGHVLCECTPAAGDGGYELAPDYGSIGDNEAEGEDPAPDAGDIEDNASNTGSATIEGDSGAGGGGVDSDQDGDIDGYEQGERSIDYGPLLQGTSLIASKFPFNLVTSLKEMAEQFMAPGQCPSFHLPIWNQTIDFDLCAFNGVASFIRTMLAFLLTAGAFWAVLSIFF